MSGTLLSNKIIQIYGYLQQEFNVLEESEFIKSLSNLDGSNFILSTYNFYHFIESLNMLYGACLTKTVSNTQTNYMIGILYKNNLIYNKKNMFFEFMKHLSSHKFYINDSYYLKNSITLPIDNLITELCNTIAKKNCHECIIILFIYEYIIEKVYYKKFNEYYNDQIKLNLLEIPYTLIDPINICDLLKYELINILKFEDSLDINIDGDVNNNLINKDFKELSLYVINLFKKLNDDIVKIWNL